MNYIYDIAIVVFFVFSFLTGLKMGFIKTLVQLVGWLAAAYVAVTFSGTIAAYLYDTYLREMILAAIRDALALESSVILSSPREAFQVLDSVKALPQFVQGLIANNADRIVAEVAQSIAETGFATLENVLEGLFASMIITALKGIVFTALFVLCSIAVKILLKALNIVKYIPVVSQVNSVLGGVAGLGSAIVKVAVFAAVVQVLSTFTAGTVPLLAESTLRSTILLRFFIEHNFILNLL